MSEDSSNLETKHKSSAQSDWRTSWGAWSALLAVLATLLFSYGTLGVLTSRVSVEGDALLALSYSFSGILLLICSWYFLRLQRVKISDFFGAPPGLKTLLSVPVLFIAYVIISSYVLELAYRILSIDVNQEQSFGFQAQSSWVGLVSIFFALVVIAPISEEVLYRGILYRGLRNSTGRVVAAIITSILFGFLHGQWNVAIDTFVLSLLLIVGLEYTKSLWTPIFLHGLKNFIAFCLLFLLT